MNTRAFARLALMRLVVGAVVLWSVTSVFQVSRADVTEVNAKFTAMSISYVRYTITKVMTHYSNPPWPGEPGYDDWPLKTRNGLCVEFLVLKGPDFYPWEQADISRNIEVPYPELVPQRLSEPTATFNCHALALTESTDVWVQGFGPWAYYDPVFGDFEEYDGSFPFTQVTVSGYGLAPSYYEVGHSSFYNPYGGPTPCYGKLGPAGMYQSAEYVLQRLFGFYTSYWRPLF